jgi:DNA mismatch repair protein MutS
VVAGAAERSYGIHVAKLAGLPKPVIRRAEAVLKMIESGGDSRALRRPVDDLPLFSAAPPVPPVSVKEPSPLEPLADLLAGVEPDALTPRDALELVYRLRRMLP